MSDRKSDLFSIIGVLELAASFGLMILATAYPTTIPHTTQESMFMTSLLLGIGSVGTMWMSIIPVSDNK